MPFALDLNLASSSLASLMALATAVLTLATVVRQGSKSKTNVQEIRVLVDGHLTRVEDRVAQLVATLEAGGLPVPPPFKDEPHREPLPHAVTKPANGERGEKLPPTQIHVDDGQP